MNIRELLNKKGLRITPQREAIYKVLYENKRHPTAEHVYHEVRKIFPAISFNTVYKTVQAFEEAGLLQRFNTGENIYHYDANVDPHPHFICLSCGAVDDMDEYTADLEEYMKEAAKASPRKIKFVNMHFYGYCPQCGNNDIKEN
ncbi:MAG: transcriptional repressor [Peptococcaceae bacterium]|nr:transcriptional repressor [Peptococcaceae bacterium]